MDGATTESSEVKRIEASLGAEPRIGWQASEVALAWVDGAILLRGEVATLAAKRLAARVAGSAAATRVIDRLRVPAGEAKADGEILEAYTNLLLRHSELQNCTIHRQNRGRAELVHQAGNPAGVDDGQWISGDIDFAVADGEIQLHGRVISLSHRRVAELLAWWVPGCRSVVNELSVVPPEADGDDEINDAVRLALEMDPLLHHRQIGVTTTEGVVALRGVVGHRADAHMAEYDAWCIAGVRDVVNRLAIG